MSPPIFVILSISLSMAVSLLWAVRAHPKPQPSGRVKPANALGGLGLTDHFHDFGKSIQSHNDLIAMRGQHLA